MKKYVLCSCNIPKECYDSLILRSFTPLLLPEYSRLQKGVSSHPDMLVFFLGNTYICTKEYYAQAKDVFDTVNELGYTPILTDELPSPDYPKDILFNALLLDKTLFGFEEGLSLSLRELTARKGIETVKVHQGYTKCSVCKVSENAIITADDGIAQAARKCGSDVLKISAGGVRLDGYDCGFIGGASGADEKSIFFCGDILSHPDGEAIKTFCHKHGKGCISLSNKPLFDVGTLFFL